MKLPRGVKGLIRLNYKSMSPAEFNNLFELRGCGTFTEEFIQSKIDLLLQKDIENKNRAAKKYKEEFAKEPLLARATSLYHSAKTRAKKKDIPFTITFQWVKNKLKQGYCEATGLPLEPKLELETNSEKSKLHPLTPSLDQIKPSEGYTIENTQMVCDFYNKMKNDKSLKDTYILAKAFVKYQMQIRKNKKQEMLQEIVG